jgi:hypothetical protein
MSLWSRNSNAVRGERLNREIEEELQSHIEEAISSFSFDTDSVIYASDSHFKK